MLIYTFLILWIGILQTNAAPCMEEISPERPEIYSLHILSQIKYRYATTNVTSKVVNPSNKSQEVVFYMNLPETAFITSFIMEMDGKQYEAYIKEKEEAKKIYDTAVASGISAGHVAVSTRDSNNFKIAVNLEAQGKAKFILSYEELLTRTLGNYKQIINLNPGQTVKDLKVQVYISESSEIKSLFVPEIKVTNEISEDKENENKLVEISRPNSKKAIIKYEPNTEDQEKVGGKCFDGQFIVEYDVERTEPGGEVLVDDGYFVHFFAPEGLPSLRKLAVFVLDLSGSMYGRKLTQLKEAMATILDELGEDDYFSIVEFSFSVTVHNLDSPSGSAVISPDSWHHEPETETKLPSTLDVQQAYPATKDYLNKAKQIISKMSAGGGTNINDALKSAVRVSQKALEKINESRDSGYVIEPIIIFLTDGEPTVGITDLRRILSTVKEINIPRTSLFSLGFGEGADINFLRKLSLANAGFARTIYEASDAALQLRNFYKIIASPLLSNVTFSYLPGQIVDGTLTKDKFHSFFSGSELIVAGKLQNNDIIMESDVRGITRNGSTIFTLKNEAKPESSVIDPEMKVILPPHPPKIPEENSFGSLERLWAYLTIQQLLDKQDTVDSNGNESKTIKDKAQTLALKYKFVTPLTSLVVVKPNKSEVSDFLEKGKGEYSFPASNYGGQPLLVGGAASMQAFGNLNLRTILRKTTHPKRTYAYPAYMMGPPRLPTHLPRPVAAAYYPTTTTSFVDRMDMQSAEEDVDSPAFTTEESSTKSDLLQLDVSNIEWLEEALHNDNKTVTIPGENSTHLNYTIVYDAENTTYQQCKTMQNSSGKCTHLVRCILPEFTHNFQEFLGYFCPISGKYVGVCCPDTNLAANADIQSTTIITL